MGEFDKMRILISGGSGRIGSRLCRYLSRAYNVIAPARNILDITKIDSDKDITSYAALILIHLAAYTDVAGAEAEKDWAYMTNVIGTRNVMKYYTDQCTKVIFLSTDYIFDGENGNYKENDIPNPINYYGLTKLLAEQAVQMQKEHLIIRTSFKSNFDAYEYGYTDMFTSADELDHIASEVTTAIVLFIHAKIPTGILHIGSERRSVFDLIRKYNNAVKPASIVDHKGARLPRDCSLDTNKWNLIKITNGLVD